ncbi:LysM-like peptidoglycan-binding domain-containing protein [Vibrio tubiashii]|uniref:LysM-like peptidoglycan-binding domain-containing protein n=1 Tax=Vibrio tubiashii TaxID=29498 RepID=UPI00234E4EDC|nr:LysM-like peptidoglycan-binding domain-containing protein [Vibrio tubiashii]WCP67391.1 LysM-like peptidoglycan-binding domain-containing protein [Vibrio tubiashii]
MNRRKKKKQQQVDYVELAKAKLNQIDWQQIKQTILDKWNLLPRLHQRALMVLTPLLLVLLVIPIPEAQTETEQAVSSNTQRVEVDINTRSLSEQKSAEQDSLVSKAWNEYEVKSGDTLAQVFRSNGLAMADLNALVKVEGSDKPLSRIKKGQLVRFKLAENGQLDILQLEKSNQSVMFFRLSDGGFGRSK